MKKLLMTASVYIHIRNFHLPYLREFQRLGWETHVACADAPDDVPFADRVIRLPLDKRMSAPGNFRAAKRLRTLVRDERYDLIIAHTVLAAFFTRLAVKGMKDRPPVINVVHGYLFDDDTPAPKRSILLAAERLTAPETDLLLTMNGWDCAAAKKYRLGKQVHEIPGLGVDFSRFDAAAAADGAALRARLGIPEDAFVLLYPAEFSARKSQHVLIEAMQTLPERAMLVLCGAGAELEANRALAKRLGLAERVRFPGQIAEMAPWYRMADAAVSASRIEGLPFNVMEAMYSGVPVAASAVKGHVDLIADGETGLLYPYGDAEKCADCIRRLMEHGALREALAERAKAHVLQYRLDRVFPILMREYTAGLGETPAQRPSSF